MGVFSFLRGVYDLDTLDTRFTNSSSTPYRTVIESRSDADASKEWAARFGGKAQRSRWRTPEFILYYLILAWAVPYMFWIAYHASQLVYPVASGGKQARPTLEEADERLKQRTSYDFGFAIVFLVALHGVSALKILTILYMNYQIVTNVPRKYIPIAAWGFNIGVLFANELCKGYKFESIATFMSGTPDVSLTAGDPFLISWGKWLDGYGGIMRRWEILFNITVLRLISFDLDYYWSLDRRSYSPIEVSADHEHGNFGICHDSADSPKKKQLDPAALSERDRISIPAQSKDFTFRNYVAYAIYAPLYLTGPILTFNDYISQGRYRSATIEGSRTIRYGVRFALCLLAMEVILHYDYVQAIAKANPSWGEYTAAQLCILSYFNLHLIWLKLLLPWRMFRLWSLVDGIDPPENMLRCVSDNYSTFMFWRSWHRSYNRWLTRYLYIPLGGSSMRDAKSAARSVFNYVVTFTFVALWHDIQLRLLIWGWLVVLFMLPEMTARSLFPARKWEDRPTTYRMISCLGAVGNVIMMMAANLVGFAVGLDGLQSILVGIFKDYSGISFLAAACVALFVGVQVMFEIREAELRRGLALKC